MAVKEIKDYSAVTSAAAADKIIVQQAADNVTRYITPTQIIGIFKAAASGLASLNASSKGAQQPASISDHLDDTAGGTNAATTKAATSNAFYDHAVATTGIHGMSTNTVCSEEAADTKDTAAIAAHAGAADPHAGYRLESADHDHSATGAKAGQLAGLAAFSGVYDSGWFAVAKNTGYNKTHNLGALPKLATVWFSANADGSAARLFGNIYNTGDYDGYGISLKTVTTTTVRVVVSSVHVLNWVTADGTESADSGYCRVILVI